MSSPSRGSRAPFYPETPDFDIMRSVHIRNLYVHFPFCRAKCSYCALYSAAGRPESERNDYAMRLAEDVSRIAAEAPGPLSTVYFGGGSPALCDLRPLLAAIEPLLAPDGSTEFTVELHPMDVDGETISILADGGVNRISMGVQSLDDAALADMRRGYTASEARRAFDKVRSRFANAGIDMIVGYPAERAENVDLSPLASWGLSHCSLYSLILEEKSILATRIRRGASPEPQDDDTVMDAMRRCADTLEGMGLRRYEIANFALPGKECRHNMATWLGEDYTGLGTGAYGREGLLRTYNPPSGPREASTLTEEDDLRERTLFRLRTRWGLDASRFPAWLKTLDSLTDEGLLEKAGGATYRLTRRGAEVCDSILAELV